MLSYVAVFFLGELARTGAQGIESLPAFLVYTSTREDWKEWLLIVSKHYDFPIFFNH